jgi:4-amino-4-deoxy-L-arabinose transferase-like glycosyltransferase
MPILRTWFLPWLWPVSAQFLLLAAIDIHLALYLSRQPDKVGTAVAAWGLALSLLIAGFWFADQERSDLRPLGLAWTRIDTLAVVCLTLLALAPRLINLNGAPYALHNDEAVVGVRALALVGQPIAPLWLADEMSLTNVWYYTVLPFIQLLGNTAAGVRFFAVVVGTATIATTYLLLRLLFPRSVALIAVFLLATFHFHIHFSRLGLSPIVDPFFGTLILSCLVIGLRTGRYLFFVLAGVLLGIAINFYTGSRLFIPLTGLMLLLWLGDELRRTGWRRWREPAIWFPVLLLGLGFLMAAAPNLQAAAADPQNFFARITAPRVTPELIAKATAEQGWTPARFWLEQVRRSVLSFYLYPESGYQGFYDDKRPLLWGLSAGLAGVGMLLIVKRARQWRYQLLILWYLLTALVGGALMSDPAAQQRYATLSIVVCLAMALVIDAVWEGVARFWPAGQRITAGLVCVLLVYLGAESLHRYFYDYLPRANYGTISSQYSTALAYFLRDQPAGTPVWFIGAPTRFMLRSHIPHYLAPHVARWDLTACSESLDHCRQLVDSLLVPSTTPTLLVTRPQQEAERTVIQQRFPQAELIAIPWSPAPAPVILVQVVPAAGP